MPGHAFLFNQNVGDHYALVGADIGLNLNAKTRCRLLLRLEENAAAPGNRWPTRKRRQRLVARTGRSCPGAAAPACGELDRDDFFEVAYEHFAEAGVWELYPEVVDVLTQLDPHFQLAIISNFDGRLRVILERLGISKFFADVFISSEIGADKPDPEIFRRAFKF